MKRIFKIKLLNIDNIDKLKREFRKLCQKGLTLFKHDLVMFPEDFDHCCYEYLRGGIYKGKFSPRRAKKMLLIEQFCKKEIDYQIILESNHKNNHLVIVSETAEYCIIVTPVTNAGKKYFRLLTTIAFGKGVESGFRRIYKNGKIITEEMALKLFPNEKKG